ncbi:MAG: hypothetical protein GY932_12220 [Arcobacter sp.]|nr:hypothetical protein [Arcobacter sp.]
MQLYSIDKKGKPLRQFTTKEEIENYKKVALKYSYIEYDDFYYLFNIYRTNNEYV